MKENKKRDAITQDVPVKLPEDLYSTNPLNLDMGEENNEECISEWQQEPAEGFVELFEENASLVMSEESHTVILSGVNTHGKMEWHLHPIEVPLPMPMLLNGITSEQSLRDPRLQ